MQIAELFARIGIKADDAQVKRFDRGLKNLKIGMTAVTITAGAVALGIRKITTEAMAGAVALKQFETETGASAQTLQKWQSVAEQTNQSAESVTSAIKAIVANQEKIKLGQGNISGFQLLGIDPRQDPFKILEELRVKTKGLSDGMKKNILSQMGVGAGMLQTLALTRDEFDAMASRAFIISPHAIETLNKTKSSVDLASRAIKYIKAQIAVGLSPQITKLTKQFTTFIKVNERGIIKGFQDAYKYLNLFMGAISNTWRVINNVVTATVGWERALKGIAIGFAAFNLVLMASPINLMIAGIILLVAVMDDLYVYSKGGNSLFGVMMDKFPKLESGIFGFIDKLIEVKDLFKAFASGDDLQIDKILDQWGTFGDIIQGLLATLEKIHEFVMPDNYDREEASARTAGQVSAVGGYQAFVKDPGKFASDVNKALTGGSGAERMLGDTIVNIQVDGAGDPPAVADSVFSRFNDALKGTQAQRSRDE